MSTTEDTFDYLVVGGGTAGAVVARRLAELTDATIALVEWGPSDEDEPRALDITRHAEMMEGEYDLDYRCEPQERGNSAIRQSRARILGGCSTHNTMIMWRPPAADLEEWEALGAEGWGPDVVLPYYERVTSRVRSGPIPPEHRNPYLADATQAAADALGVPLVPDWNTGFEPVEGAGFLDIGYHPETRVRSSASVSYLHPLADLPDRLRVLLGLRAVQVLVTGARAHGVRVVDGEGRERVLTARHEVVLTAGAIDTPRLLQLSGIGPRAVLEAAGVPVLLDLPGVGENLMDHPEGLVVWEAARALPDVRAADWDAAVLARMPGSQEQRPDLLVHVPLLTWAEHATALGHDVPEPTLSLTPNVARARSRGRVWVDSADPERPPRIDYRSFTDPDGHDERVLVEGVRMARRIAQVEPFASWVGRELFPGPDVQDDEELSALVRATHHTVYHVSGTCRMGAVDDPSAVVDPTLRVRGLDGLRVADASVFPVLTAVNPVGTVFTVAERAADLLAADWPGR
ncbi:GMC family oxidoreductase [Nocardioides sp. GY 10127]|uniref:GMC family oxidoreductase n=1 Tax=Nocardioides sp. GY 10127 TaxID=2569762 RepID=UPI0010A7F4F6|nr:GMC family oxidoreductase [Nocardioides sp. GY 10127]TIC85697.1 GMC family oxidoreductase [Nocardioides sp. GY 10127]